MTRDGTGTQKAESAGLTASTKKQFEDFTAAQKDLPEKFRETDCQWFERIQSKTQRLAVENQ